MNLPIRPRRFSNRRAFTVIELLVAVGVTALMVSLMLTIVVNVLSGWNKSSGTLTSGNQARLVLDQISRDLQSAILKRDGNGWMVATIQQNQSNTGDAGVSGAAWVAAKPSAPGSSDPTSNTTSFVVPSAVNGTIPLIDDYRFGQGGVWLRFFTSGPDSNDGLLQHISAPRAVAYQIVRLPVVANSKEIRYQLFRSEVRPGHSNATLAARSTFAAGYNLLDPAAIYNIPSATNSGVYINGTVDEGGEPGSIRRPDRNQLIANNVIDFGVRVWARNSTNTLVITFPSSLTNFGFAATTNDGTSGKTAAIPPGQSSGAVTATQMTYGFPEVIEVFVRILTDDGVNQIANFEDGRIPGNWWDIALANSRVYSRRIEIKSTGL